ncbi:acyltransferase [Chishuiella sp.]|uniref:acyltransferase family protein n=1 Tax=Chishuiella sp. TaxID=1969467 RepID=UPI0028A7B878|nr:acyltransferase [Chishuiella sp.]
MKLPNLNALRFIAALAVIIHHTEQLKSLYNLPNKWENNTIFIIGKLGVVLFFVLSGFLITHLLLNEIDNTNRINIKNFFMRRILRIWPLYFLIIILSFFIFPHFSFFDYPGKPFDLNNFPIKQLFLYIFILPNLAVANLSPIAYATQSWSIGTEEQFYLIWPFLFIFFKNKKLLISIFLIIPIYLIIKCLLDIRDIKIIGLSIHNFWKFFNIDCMAIGGLIALLNKNYHNKIKFLLNNVIFYLTSLSTVLLIYFGVDFGYFHYEVYACLFVIIIYNLAFNPNLKNILEFKILDKLGEISYGMYMYHIIIISVIIKLMLSFDIYNSFILYFLSIITIIIFSKISYTFFEKPFLKFKNKFK